MVHRASNLAWALVLVGCAEKAAPPPEAPRHLDESIAAWKAEDEREGRPVVRAADTPATTAIVPPREQSPPTSRRRIDIEFSGAPLGQALQMLADAAGRPLVLGRTLDKPITASLKRADPLRALYALAAANGVTVESKGGSLFVR